MLTLRQIERLWNAKDFPRLARELLAGRAELSARTLLDSSHRVPCAALALIRIDEYAQNFHPLCQSLIKSLLSAQDPDGGWGDAATTALVLRALSTSRGQGLSIERGLAFLAHLQRDDGLFPRIPLKRTEGDPHTTALILHHLTHVPAANTRINTAAALVAINQTTAAKPSKADPLTPNTRRLTKPLAPNTPHLPPAGPRLAVA